MKKGIKKQEPFILRKGKKRTQYYEEIKKLFGVGEK